MTKLNISGAPALISQLTTRAIVSLILLLTFFCVSQNALAQNLQPRAVARLISGPAADARNSRPRRVTPAESLGSTTKSGASIALAFDKANAIERRAFEQTNVVRAENGLPPLTWDPQLCRMAREHSEQMAKRGYFSHETPEGLQLKDRAHENGILHFRVIGENIAYNKGYDDPGGFAVERWMTSAGHRANMLYVGFEASAIGSYVAADGSTYLTQVFIAR
ncbi:MAG: CAP domain-containing protein [bacterium]